MLLDARDAELVGSNPQRAAPRAAASANRAFGSAGTMALRAATTPVGCRSSGGVGSGQNGRVRVERSRDNVFVLTATSQELSALVAGARMAFEAMRAAPQPPPPEVLEILERVLADFDRARRRLSSAEAAAAEEGE